MAEQPSYLAERIQAQVDRLDGLAGDLRELRLWRDTVTATLAELAPLMKNIDRKLDAAEQRRDALAAEREKQREEDERTDRDRSDSSERWRVSSILQIAAFCLAGNGILTAIVVWLVTHGGHP